MASCPTIAPATQPARASHYTRARGRGKANAVGYTMGRAEAVRDWLVEAGIPAAKLTIKGYGSNVPIADNRIKEGRTKNRRVQFIILETKK